MSRKLLCKPMPLKLKVDFHNLNWGGGPPKNTAKKGISDTPPPKLRVIRAGEREPTRCHRQPIPVERAIVIDSSSEESCEEAAEDRERELHLAEVAEPPGNRSSSSSEACACESEEEEEEEVRQDLRRPRGRQQEEAARLVRVRQLRQQRIVIQRREREERRLAREARVQARLQALRERQRRREEEAREAEDRQRRELGLPTRS